MRSFPLALAVLALVLVARSAAASIVDVSISGISFSPKDVVIQAGDTVRWTWTSFHNIESGGAGIHDGNFTSGPLSVGGSYQVVFDGSYLAAHPMPSNVYPYYCAAHVFSGMVGSVRVLTAATASPYGCGGNPAASLVLAAGAPQLGASLDLTVHNPLGTQASGSLALLAPAVAAAPGYPCGLSVPGWGMSAPGALGELLLEVAPSSLLPLLGPQAWLGLPRHFLVALPSSASLIGLHVYFQGVIVDPLGAVGIGLTSGLDCRLGT